MNIEAHWEWRVRDYTKCFFHLNVLHLGSDSISPAIDNIMYYSSQQLTFFGEMPFLNFFQR